MGDSCRFSIETVASDFETMEKLLNKAVNNNSGWSLFNEVEVWPGGHKEGVVYEANYGWYTEIHSMVAEEEVPPFLASHGSGGEHPSAVVAHYKGEIAWCAESQGSPVVPLLQHGDLSQPSKTITGRTNDG